MWYDFQFYVRFKASLFFVESIRIKPSTSSNVANTKILKIICRVVQSHGSSQLHTPCCRCRIQSIRRRRADYIHAASHAWCITCCDPLLFLIVDRIQTIVDQYIILGPRMTTIQLNEFGLRRWYMAGSFRMINTFNVYVCVCLYCTKTSVWQQQLAPRYMYMQTRTSSHSVRGPFQFVNNNLKLDCCYIHHLRPYPCLNKMRV